LRALLNFFCLPLTIIAQEGRGCDRQTNMILHFLCCRALIQPKALEIFVETE
jgi:hypothetical protein